MTSAATTLTPADRELHRLLGITPVCLERFGVQRVDDRQARQLLCLNGRPGRLDGLIYPYLDPIDGHVGTRRLRRDHCEYEDGKPKNKYLVAHGDHRHLYFPLGIAALLSDTSVPIVFVEAEKSVMAIACAADRACRRVLPIGLGGCHSWRGRVGKTTDAHGARIDEVGPLPDLYRIAWLGREAIILFDARPNTSVQLARQQFARVLRSWGAVVKHAHLPDDDERVNGPDDLVRWHGDVALWAVIDRALPEEFIRDAKGIIVRNALDNIRIALAKLPTRVVYDAFRREINLNGQPADDVALDRLWLAIDDAFHFRPLKDTLRTVIVGEAHTTLVNPVRTYLDAL